MMRPASIVFPRPVSSAMKRLTRGRLEGLSEGLHLVRVDLDAGAEGGLEERRVGGGRATPAEGVEEGGEMVWGVEAVFAEVGPGFVVENGAVEFAVPEDFEFLALGVVVGAG